MERISAKIMSLHRSYKDACEKVNQSGYGLEGDAHSSFFEYIYTICKWYDQMNPVFGSKPSSFALYANEVDNNPENEQDNDQYHSNDEYLDNSENPSVEDDNDSNNFDSDIEDSEHRDSPDKDKRNTINDTGLRQLSIDEGLSVSSSSSSSLEKSPRKKTKVSRPSVIQIDGDNDESNNMSTPGTSSSKSVSTKKNGKGRITKFISSITSRQLKNNKVVTAHDARKNVRNTKSIVAKKTISKNGDNEIDELISFKKEVFARQTVHDKEKLRIEEKRMLFDER